MDAVSIYFLIRDGDRKKTREKKEIKQRYWISFQFFFLFSDPTNTNILKSLVFIVLHCIFSLSPFFIF